MLGENHVFSSSGMRRSGLPAGLKFDTSCIGHMQSFMHALATLAALGLWMLESVMGKPRSSSRPRQVPSSLMRIAQG